MTLRIDITFVFTEEARAIAENEPSASWQLPEGMLSATPIQGDLVSFREDGQVFEVKNRLFIWKGAAHLIVQPLLGLAAGIDYQGAKPPRS